MVECGYISNGATLVTSMDADKNHVTIDLKDAPFREQKLFNAAMTELVTPILLYLVRKKDHVQILAQNLENSIGHFEPVYIEMSMEES